MAALADGTTFLHGTTVSTTTATTGGLGLSYSAVVGIIFGVIGTIVAILSFLCVWRRCNGEQRPEDEQTVLPSPENTDIEREDQPSQQSSSVDTVSPNQPQVEVQKMSIGGNHNTFFLGPATGNTVNQNVIQNVTGTPDLDQVRAVGKKAKEALKKVYTTTGSYVQMLPWVDDDKIHIMKIYTKLHLVEQVDTREKIQTEENEMESYQQMNEERSYFVSRKDKCEMQSYEEIFQFKTQREGNPIKRVVIRGSAGIGKTTLIEQIAYDWALGYSETLNKYELVFELKMRSLKPSSDLVDAIFDHILDKDSVDQSALKEFVDNNQDKVLILLDGFDEFKIATIDTSSFGSILKVLNRKQGTECWVVITSRPPLDKLVNSSLVEKPYTHVAVEGFSDTDIKDYVNKFFPKDHDKASKLIEQIELSYTLSDLAKSPMLLLLMCLLWDAENTLPDTMTRLYNKALKYIFKRRTRHIKDDAISETLISIGKVALGLLLSNDQSFAFREEDFEKSALSAAMIAGVLTSERVIDGLDTYQRVSFIHHTLLEYCAAMYWQSLINTEKFNGILNQIDIELTESTALTPHAHLSRYDYLLRFCCGDNEACTNLILKKGHQDMSLQLAIICYFESQSQELPPTNVISSVLTGDINISYWKNDSANALFYFLKRVTALGRGNDSFTEVTKLVMDRVNSQRYGEDLAKSLKLMSNLQSLSLEHSSLTTAQTSTILSSLASPSTLAEINLSRNQTLGGHVSLLAPQLKKLQCLKELYLAHCSLVAQDVPPIAESVGDTLVVLDVSGNTKLGGCASILGPQLGKMECLQNIYLVDCSLEDTDVVALSDISTLVHLDLTRNCALGGHASSWALHLKRMNHLKELKLVICNLRQCDMEPIAESVPTLVYLDLSGNCALGRRASLWAQHLKRMNHLKKLTLKGCNLKGCDMEPIAESVSDMSTLRHLDLSMNYALSGRASLWAFHLKKMTKHLKELKMYRCLLTDEDELIINAVIGSNSPILKTRYFEAS